MGQAPAQMWGQAPAQVWGQAPAQMWAIVEANVVLSHRSRLRCCSQFAQSVRTDGPVPDAFWSKHVCPRQSRLGAHALQKVRRNSNHREKSILQTNNLYQSGKSGLTILTRTNSAKHVRANRTANPAEVGGEGLGQVPA